MDSLATVLRRIPLFTDLPPGSFAKIIADLREERHPPGAVICYEGDEARDFYIIKSRQVEVLVNRGGNQRELVAVSGPQDWFGERALFSNRPRAAIIVARTEVELWQLTPEKFLGLIEENPWLILHFHRGHQQPAVSGQPGVVEKTGRFQLSDRSPLPLPAPSAAGTAHPDCHPLVALPYWWLLGLWS